MRQCAAVDQMTIQVSQARKKRQFCGVPQSQCPAAGVLLGGAVPFLPAFAS